MDYLYAIERLYHQMSYLKPFVVEGFHLLHLEHPLEPLRSESVFSEFLAVVGEVCDFEEVLEIGYGQTIACYEGCLSLLK